MIGYYFGCWDDRKGHFLHETNGQHVRQREGVPSSHIVPAILSPDNHAILDGAWCPADEPGGEYQAQGRALRHHVHGWTVLAFWDRSIDQRYASNSAFLLHSEQDFEGALAWSRRLFPSVFTRFEVPTT